MDHRDHMALSGSASYYMQQRGLAGSGGQPELHASPNFHQMYSPNLPFQSGIGGGSSNIGSTLPFESSMISSQGVNVNNSTPTGIPSGEAVKRKRGRPRKYGSESSDIVVSLASSPSATPSSNPGTTMQDGQKRGRGRPIGSGKKQQLASLGELIPALAGVPWSGVTPYLINIESGEDIASKVLAFSQVLRTRAVCIMAADGSVSSATLRQPSTLGGTVKFEGHYEILSLSGSYLPTNGGSSRNRTGELTVSFVSPDDTRVLGGAVGGPLIASGPVKVFVYSYRLKAKNNKRESSEDAEVAVESNGQGLNNNPVASRSMNMRNSNGDIDLMRD